MPHLFPDISAHGYGHLAQAAPVLNRLADLIPDLRLTLRCGLPESKLRQRIRAPFRHLSAASDFGYAMIDALTIDHAAHADIPAVALCSLNWADLFHHHFGHEDWAARVHAEMLAAVPPAPTFDGAERAAHHLAALLT